MLAAIQNDQQPLVAQMAGQDVEQRVPGRIVDSQRGRCRFDDHARIGKRREIDHPAAVGEVVERLQAKLPREPRLADAANPHERQQPILGKEAARIVELAPAPDEPRSETEEGCAAPGVERLAKPAPTPREDARSGSRDRERWRWPAARVSSEAPRSAPRGWLPRRRGPARRDGAGAPETRLPARSRRTTSTSNAFDPPGTASPPASRRHSRAPLRSARTGSRMRRTLS